MTLTSLSTVSNPPLELLILQTSFILQPEKLVRLQAVNYNIQGALAILIRNNFYFHRLPQIWNAHPVIKYDLNLSTIKQKLTNYQWNYFKINFISNNACTFPFLCLCYQCNKNPKDPNLNNL